MVRSDDNDSNNDGGAMLIVGAVVGLVILFVITGITIGNGNGTALSVVAFVAAGGFAIWFWRKTRHGREPLPFAQEILAEEVLQSRSTQAEGPPREGMMSRLEREAAARDRTAVTRPVDEVEREELERLPVSNEDRDDDEPHVGLLETGSVEEEIRSEIPEIDDQLTPRMYTGVMRPHIFPTLGWRVMGLALGLVLWFLYLVFSHFEAPLLPLYTGLVVLLMGAATVVPMVVGVRNSLHRYKRYRAEHRVASILLPLCILGGLVLLAVILAIVHIDLSPLLIGFTWAWNIIWAVLSWCVQSFAHLLFALAVSLVPPMLVRYALWLVNPMYMANGELVKVTGFFVRTRGAMDLSEVTDVKDHRAQIPWFKRLKVPWADVELENPGQNQAFNYLKDLPFRHAKHIREGVIWAKQERPRR